MAEIALTPTDEKIILKVYQYHYLTREQIATLWISIVIRRGPMPEKL